MIKSILAGFSLIAIASAALPMPVTVQNCGRDITFEEVPNRAVSSDVNLTEIMLALGLEDRMVGYAGISDLRRLGPEFLDAASRLVALSPRYPTREILLGAGADFYFAGWNYGLRLGGELTPDSLERLGIKAYVLTESCIHVTEKSRASMDDLYTDIRNLGKIFGIEAKAEALIGRFKDEIANIVDSVDTPAGPKPRVFVYDSGQDVPFTAGRYAMPNALIEAAGGVNTMSDFERSWATVTWEEVVARDPEVIIIVDYGEVTAEQKIDFLLAKDALANIRGVRNRRFVILEYAELTPGPRNINAIRLLAAGL